jgi:hypothetical protein
MYVIATAKNGIGQMKDSRGTPLGLHEIREKFGDAEPLGTVFVGRKSTGKLIGEFDDWESKNYVVSRILRLNGLEEGYNHGGNCDTYDRYIYIHGIGNEAKIGTPWTSGCIAMLNENVVELYAKINLGSFVLITR